MGILLITAPYLISIAASKSVLFFFYLVLWLFAWLGAT